MVFIMAAGGVKGSLAFVKSLYTDPFRWFVYFFVYGCSCGYLLVPGTLLLLRGRKRRKKRRVKTARNKKVLSHLYRNY